MRRPWRGWGGWIRNCLADPASRRAGPAGSGGDPNSEALVQTLKPLLTMIDHLSGQKTEGPDQSGLPGRASEARHADEAGTWTFYARFSGGVLSFRSEPRLQRSGTQMLVAYWKQEGAQTSLYGRRSPHIAAIAAFP
jgi:hypothetical protein